MCDLPPAPSWRPCRMNPVSDAPTPSLILGRHCDAAVKPPLTHPPTLGVLRWPSSRDYAHTHTHTLPCCKVFITFWSRSGLFCRSLVAFTAPRVPVCDQRPTLGPRERTD